MTPITSTDGALQAISFDNGNTFVTWADSSANALPTFAPGFTGKITAYFNDGNQAYQVTHDGGNNWS